MMTYLARVLGEDYKGEHQAPGKSGDDKPLHDLVGIYPADFYEGKAREYANTGETGDGECVSIMLACKGKPKKAVKIYRAVPKVMSKDEKMADLMKKKAAWQRRNRVPHDVNMSKQQYSAWIWDQIEKLEKAPDEPAPDKITINKGDWVTLSKAYAIEHGKSNLNGKYRILTKTVPASTLWTDGNSVCEWGYDP